MSKKLPWVQLSGKQEPPFDKLCLIWVVTEQGEEGFIKAKLRDINNRGGVKKYVFVDEDDKLEWNNATHYMIIEKPKE